MTRLGLILGFQLQHVDIGWDLDRSHWKSTALHELPIFFGGKIDPGRLCQRGKSPKDPPLPQLPSKWKHLSTSFRGRTGLTGLGCNACSKKAQSRHRNLWNGTFAPILECLSQSEATKAPKAGPLKTSVQFRGFSPFCGKDQVYQVLSFSKTAPSRAK